MLIYQQLTKQVSGNRIFLVLLALLSTLTSMSFFFVRFTIDGNLHRVDEITVMGGDAARYQAALASNRILAYSFWAATITLTAFVLFIFFYRFFRTERRQLGCLKALGFKDKELRGYFVAVAAALSVFGSMMGLLAAFPLSTILLQANIDAYGVSGLEKSLHASSLFFCLFFSAAILSLVAFFSYGSIKGKEPGDLIAGNLYRADDGKLLRAADRVANLLPVKNKFSVRLVLRKPLAILLILIAVMGFTVCMIIAYSLNLSSSKVLIAQTEGHNYEYVTSYSQYLTSEAHSDESMEILRMPAALQKDKTEIAYQVSGLYYLNQLYVLQDDHDLPLDVPNPGTAIIGHELREVYGIHPGDSLSLVISGKSIVVTVVSIATNAQSGVIYVNGNELAESVELPRGSYNVLLSTFQTVENFGECVSRSDRIDLLERDAVSNKVSGVINQVIGVVAGSILLFLALYMNVQDNTRDILILQLMGYQPKVIRKMFIEIYQPLVWIFFFILLLPSILLVQWIQKNLSVTTGDYMPFGINLSVIIVTFIGLTLINQLVQGIFGLMIKGVVRKEALAKYMNVE